MKRVVAGVVFVALFGVVAVFLINPAPKSSFQDSSGSSKPAVKQVTGAKTFVPSALLDTKSGNAVLWEQFQQATDREEQEVILQKIARINPRYATAQIIENTPPDRIFELVSVAINSWAKVSPEECAIWCFEDAIHPISQDFGRHAIEAWFNEQNDTPEIGQWIYSSSELSSENRSAALQTLIQLWGERDPRAMTQWASEQTSLDDDSITQLVFTIAGVDSEGALSWNDQIKNEQVKLENRRDILELLDDLSAE